MNRKYPLNIKYFGAVHELFDFIKNPLLPYNLMISAAKLRASPSLSKYSSSVGC